MLARGVVGSLIDRHREKLLVGVIVFIVHIDCLSTPTQHYLTHTGEKRLWQDAPLSTRTYHIICGSIRVPPMWHAIYDAEQR